MTLSSRSEGQDPRISVVTVTEDTLAPFPCRSPVDRAFPAELIDMPAASGARADGERGVQGLTHDQESRISVEFW